MTLNDSAAQHGPHAVLAERAFDAEAKWLKGSAVKKSYKFLSSLFPN